MKELSLNILDITKNSTAARASDILVSLVTDAKGILTLTISDNGCGMDEETLKRVSDPFYTTRTTRKVGLGIPLLRLAAEQTGGSVTIESTTDEIDHGTKITATFDTLHIDFCPVGDIISSICVLISGNPEIDFVFIDETPERRVHLDTKELRAVLGDVSLAQYEVIKWIEEYLKSQYNEE